MQLIANFRIRGVKKVISGKGKGTTVAHPNDLFEPVNEKSGSNLLKEQAARLPGESAPGSSLRSVGPEITQEKQEPSQPETLETIAPKAAEPKQAKGDAKAAKAAKTEAKVAKAAKTEAKNEDIVADDSLDDLGLGDGSTDE